MRIADRRDRALDARLAQQMQHRIGRAIGVILDIVGSRLRELILRMETRHLQLSFEIQLGNGGIADFEEIVELHEVRKHQRVDEQRGFPIRRRGGRKRQQLGTQILKKPGGAALLADREVHAIASIRMIGERAQVEADHRFFDPAPGCGNYFITMNSQFPSILMRV